VAFCLYPQSQYLKIPHYEQPDSKRRAVKDEVCSKFLQTNNKILEMHTGTSSLLGDRSRSWNKHSIISVYNSI